MLPQCSHITKKRGVYYYRRRVPMTRTVEVTISLQTRSYRCAEYRAQRLDCLFVRIVRTMTDHAKIASILRDYLTNRIAEDEARWLRAPEGISASNKEFLAPTRMVRSHRESAKLAVFYSEAIESLFGKLQRF